jgi:GTPase SAR1 family protein
MIRHEELKTMPLVSPTTRKLCPFCIRFFHLSEAPIISLRTGTVLEPKSHHPLAVQHQFYVPSLDEDKYLGQLPRRSCPYCSAALPANIDHMSNRLIAIIGSSQAGKSHYIAALLHQLLNTTVLRDVGCEPLSFADEETDREYHDRYYTPLIINHSELPATQGNGVESGATRPLIYQLVRRNHFLMMNRHINLIFFDTAGEDLNDSDSMELHSRYIAFASGIIFLVDPLQIPAINSLMPASAIQNIRINTVNIPEKIINRVQNLLQRQRKMKPGEQSTIPAAFVLSKIDMLRLARPIPQPVIANDSPIYREATHQGGFDINDHAKIQQEVISVLQRHESAAIVDRAMSFFHHAAFFGVSATGESPNAEHRFPNIRSIRVVDPVLWLIYQLGMIGKSSAQAVPLPEPEQPSLS